MTTAAQRSLIGRIAAHSMHAKHDPRETTAAGRAAFMRRFEDEVDPDRVLSDAERARRAESARKAYMAKLALKSAQARSKNSSVARSASPAVRDAAPRDAQSASTGSSAEPNESTARPTTRPKRRRLDKAVVASDDSTPEKQNDPGAETPRPSEKPVSGSSADRRTA